MNRIPRILFVLALTLLLTFGAPTAAHAQGIIYGDTIPAGTVVDHDVVLIGQAVTVDGTVNGNVFILGNQVTVNGIVDGSLVLIGQNASIGGVVTGAVYAAALTLDLAPSASLERDLYVVTVSLTSGKNSHIARDLFAVGLDSGLNGQVGRDLHTVIGPIQLYNGLMTLIGFPDLTIKLHFETPQPATSGSGTLLTQGRHARIIAVERIASAFNWGKWGLALLRSWVMLFIFSLLAYWLTRKPLGRSGEQIGAAFWRALGTGLIVLVIAFALFGVAVLVAVLIFAIGLGLNFLGLWQISIALWVAAYACLMLAVMALWFFISYGTKIIAVYFASTALFALLFKRKALWLDLLALLAGTVIYSLLRSIPYVGWVFGVLAMALGAGAAWMAYRKPRLPVKTGKTRK
jgi:hypothetical protein